MERSSARNPSKVFIRSGNSSKNAGTGDDRRVHDNVIEEKKSAEGERMTRKHEDEKNCSTKWDIAPNTEIRDKDKWRAPR